MMKDLVNMMKDFPTDEVILDIPLHHQRQDFTCGSACLMMAMKYFDSSLEMSVDLEIDIWREANLVEDWATCGRGLAYSAAKRGYGAKIFASVDDIPFKDKILKVSPKADPKVLDFFFRDMKRRALAMDVPEITKRVTFEDIAFAIRHNLVPILLVNAKFLHDEDTPHWIVVRGWNRQGIFINDPLWTIPRTEPILITTFMKMIGYGSGQILIVVFRKNRLVS